MRCSWSLLQGYKYRPEKTESPSMFTMFLNSALWNLGGLSKAKVAGMSQGSAVSHVAHSDYTGLSSGGNVVGRGSRVGSQAQSQHGSATWGLIFC